MKPRVMSLVVLTALAGMLVAPSHTHPLVGFASLAAIAIGAGASGALNMWWDADIDARMARTRLRAVPSGLIAPKEALGFGLTLSLLSVLTLAAVANLLAGGAARLHDLLLCRDLHDVAEAADAAEHRDRRRGGRTAADRRLRGGERRRDLGQHLAVRAHLHVDAAAFLGAGARQGARLRARRRADDAERQGP